MDLGMPWLRLDNKNYLVPLKKQVSIAFYINFNSDRVFFFFSDNAGTY